MAILQKGSPAPVFKGLAQNGNIISLTDFVGKKVILYFYPKDSTPGCTAEACNLKDNYQTLIEKGFVVIGVSADSDKSHDKFIEKYGLPFPLISDKDKVICQQYGVWGNKKFMGRSFLGINRKTFVIDEKGIIEAVFEKVDTKNHTQQILTELNLL